MKILAALVILVSFIAVLGGHSGRGGYIHSNDIHFDHKLFKDCIGDYNETALQESQSVCESCYRKFTSEDLYDKCRKKCYTSAEFKFCEQEITINNGSNFGNFALHLWVKRVEVFPLHPLHLNYTTPEDCIRTLYIEDYFRFANSREDMVTAELICIHCDKKNNDSQIYSQCRDKCYTNDVFLNCGRELGIKYSIIVTLYASTSRFSKKETRPGHGPITENIDRQLSQDCIGDYNEIVWQQKLTVCESCYRKFSSEDLYDKCREKCYTSAEFKFCEHEIKNNNRSDFRLTTGIHESKIWNRVQMLTPHPKWHFNYNIPEDCTLYSNGDYTYFHDKKESMFTAELICTYCDEKNKDGQIYSQCRDKCYTNDVFLNCGKELGIKYSKMAELYQTMSPLSANESRPGLGEHPVSHDCIGDYNKTVLQEKQNACDKCYKILNISNLEAKCKKNCYKSIEFEFCEQIDAYYNNRTKDFIYYPLHPTGPRTAVSIFRSTPEWFSNYTAPEDCIYHNRREMYSRLNWSMFMVELICMYCHKKHPDRQLYSQCRDKCYANDVLLNCGKELGIEHSKLIRFHQDTSKFYKNETTIAHLNDFNRDIPEECRHDPFVQSNFKLLQNVCEYCYGVNKTKSVYEECRQDCFTSETYHNCKWVWLFNNVG